MRKATEVKGNVLVLTSDPKQLALLQAKLQVYGARALPVQETPGSDPDSIYKYRLLSELLDKRLLDVDAWEREFAKYAWYRHDIFRNAVEVITAYNKGDLSNIIGGGLS